MRTAIITGSQGLVGSALAQHLMRQGVRVLALGRSREGGNPIAGGPQGNDALFVEIEMEQIHRLDEVLAGLGWDIGPQSVFYNFAWKGKDELTDGSLEDQLQNVVWATEAIRVAKRLGCSKFINAGSFEETFTEENLQVHFGALEASFSPYGNAKLACRDFSKLVSYLEKIDYIHTRFSIVVTPRAIGDSYVSRTIEKIFNGEVPGAPNSDQVYNFVWLEDLVRAFELIGQCGKNQADYFIGSQVWITLAEFFGDFCEHVNGNPGVSVPRFFDGPGSRARSPESLTLDTGFVISTGMANLVRKVADS